MPGGENIGGKIEEPDHATDGVDRDTGFPREVKHGVDGVCMTVHVLPEGCGGFKRREVVTLQVFDDHKVKSVYVVDVADHAGNAVEIITARDDFGSTIATFTGDDLIGITNGADN
jgi:hypothetical protein